MMTLFPFEVVVGKRLEEFQLYLRIKRDMGDAGS